MFDDWKALFIATIFVITLLIYLFSFIYLFISGRLFAKRIYKLGEEVIFEEPSVLTTGSKAYKGKVINKLGTGLFIWYIVEYSGHYCDSKDNCTIKEELRIVKLHYSSLNQKIII